MRSAMWKTTFREIKNSLGRYLAIFAIVALGVGFFVGLKITRPVMIATVQDFLDDQHFYDFRLMSTLGFTDEDLREFQSLADVKAVEGAVSVDVLYESGEDEYAIRLHSITNGINDCYLTAGRMPETADECVVDSRMMTEAELGTEIKIAADNDGDTLDMVVFDRYKVVGIVQNPLYLNFERGTTALGNGQLAGYVFLPESGFDFEYYTEIYVAYDQNFALYSDAYEDFIDAHEDAVDEAAAGRVDIRYTSIMDEANERIADGEAELSDAKQELADNEQKLKDAEQEVADGEEEISRAVEEIAEGEVELADAREQLEDGEEQLEDAKKQLKDGEAQLKDAKKQLKDGEEELEKNRQKAKEEFADARKKIDDAASELAKNEKTIEEGKTQLKQGEKTLLASKEELKARKAGLEENKEQLKAGLLEIAAKREELGAMAGLYEEALAAEEAKLNQTLAQVEAGLKEIEAGEKTLAESQKELEAKKKELAKGEQALEEGTKELASAEKEYKKNYAAYETEIKNAEKKLADARAEIARNEKKLADARAEIARNEKELADAREEIVRGESELADAKKEVEDGREELEDAKRKLSDAEEQLEDGRQQLADAEQELADAKEEVADIPEPQHYVLGRDSNVGYVCFESDSMIVDNIADVFPAFFFLVALLVCITTMNRMVDEGRTQIGVLKALGYSKAAVMWEYIFYSGSSALLGGVIGYAVGSTVFPYVIWHTYGIMYEVRGTHFVFSGYALLFSVLVSLVCSVGATMFSCYVEFASVPASLMRPKPPKSGRRIFLEYVKPVWSHLSFLQKVSVRNVLRYKKRFFMMVLGISGCTALLLTGQGLKDSIVNIADNQYDRIQMYDIDLSLKDAADADKRKALREDLSSGIKDSLFLHSDTVDVINKNLTKQVTLVVPQQLEGVDEFWHLYTSDGEEIPYPRQSEAVITEKTAKKLQLNVGDTLTVRDDAMQTMTVTVTGIAVNYVYNYLYISEETYRKGFGAEPEYRRMCVHIPENADPYGIAAEFADHEDVLQITVTAAMRERINSMMESLDAVVWLIIVSAGALAFIVLYNLTNINIMERIREIATIKVLGFYPGETAQYVFRENMLLTGIGALAGLLLGRWLHAFVMHNIDIDMVSFAVHISPKSYLLSVVLTFVFSMLVDIVMYWRLEKINMAESLKSIE